MVSLKVLEQEFDKYYFNMMYDEAMQVVGKMQINNYTGQARYCELLIYYEQGKFEKIRNRLKNKRIEKIEERELYLCSLLELQLYEEFYKEYKVSDIISVSCVQYIGGLLFSQGVELERIKTLGNQKAIDIPTYMMRRFRWFVANTFADIYCINEERIQMIESGMSEEDVSYLYELLQLKFESVRIKDSFREEIKEQVESNKHIDQRKILWFPIAYCGRPNKKGSVSAIRSFDNLYDIVQYLDLCRKIDYQFVEADAFVEYGEKLLNAVRDGNGYVINFIRKLYSDVAYHRRYEINDRNDTLADVLLSCLKKYAPYVIEDIENHENDKKINRILTTKGQFAYKAAIWQFEQAMNANYGTIDAGMLCLSYMRILELEINERIFLKLLNHTGEILDEYKSFIDHIEDEENKKKHKETWNFCINSITKELVKKGSLELGPIYTVFDLSREKKFKKKNPDFEMSEKLRHYINRYLTNEGKTALLNGTLAEIVSPKIRNKYRNPPAHTRYVRLETALECREYVEEKLFMLNRYIEEQIK